MHVMFGRVGNIVVLRGVSRVYRLCLLVRPRVCVILDFRGERTELFAWVICWFLGKFRVV